MESSLEGNGGDLMDQCSWHDTPPAFSVNLTNWLGHDLDIGLSALESRVLTSQWLGGKNAPFEANLPVPLGDTTGRSSLVEVRLFALLLDQPTLPWGELTARRLGVIVFIFTQDCVPSVRESRSKNHGSTPDATA